MSLDSLGTINVNGQDVDRKTLMVVAYLSKRGTYVTREYVE